MVHRWCTPSCGPSDCFMGHSGELPTKQRSSRPFTRQMADTVRRPAVIRPDSRLPPVDSVGNRGVHSTVVSIGGAVARDEAGQGMAPARPGFDPELKAGLAVVGGFFPPTVTPDLIDYMREAYASPPIEDTLRGRAITLEDLTIAGYRGDPITVSVLRPARASGLRPGVVFTHSSGMMFGDRFSGIELV